MKSSMDYGTNSYGNTDNARSYTVKLVRQIPGGDVAIKFLFDEPAKGRGVGRSSGQVTRTELQLPRSTAQALSHALQLVLSDTASTELQFKIDETQ